MHATHKNSLKLTEHTHTHTHTHTHKHTHNRVTSFSTTYANAASQNATLFREVWPVHRWTARNPPDIVDVMVEEDKYVAGYDRRSVMSRDVLATLVDTSVLQEALALEA